MTENMDFLKIILESGPVVKLVLITLIIISVYSWSLIFYKRKKLTAIENENNEFFDYFSKASSLADINTKSSEYGNSTFSTIFNSSYQELTKINEQIKSNDDMSLAKYFNSNGKDAINRSMQKGVNQSNEVMDHKLSPLATISSVAPFIGLFGTVWGIINSFKGLSSGGGTIEAVAPGIAEALIATAVGLLAAIPANWFFNAFTNRINNLNSKMDSFTQDLMNLIERIVMSKR
jgi:biopolymer transport protein TolQ